MASPNDHRTSWSSPAVRTAPARRRTARSTGIALVASLLGCGGEVTSPNLSLHPFTSGARLRARVRDGGDGALSFVRWVDTRLQTDCLFSVAEDGRLRCVPVSTASVGFADPGCTRRVVSARTGCGSPSPIAVLSRPAEGANARCGPPTHAVVRAGSRVASGAASYALDPITGACASVDGGQTHDLFEAIPVAPTELVEASESVQSFGDRVGARMLHTADGASQWWIPFDTSRNAPCAFHGVRFSGDISRCLPRSTFWAPPSLFGDSACRSRVAFTNEEACLGLPEAAIDFGIGGNLGVRTILGRHEGPSYELTSAECSQRAPLEGNSFWRVGETAPESLAPRIPDHVVGRGRLRVSYVRGSIASTFVDSASQTLCRVFTIGDGLYCATDAGVTVSSVNLYFAEPTCTQPVAGVVGDVNEQVPVLRNISYDGLCAPSVRPSLHRLTGRHTGTVYRREAGRCVGYSSDDSPLRYHTVSEPIAPPFPRVMERVE